MKWLTCWLQGSNQSSRRPQKNTNCANRVCGYDDVEGLQNVILPLVQRTFIDNTAGSGNGGLNNETGGVLTQFDNQFTDDQPPDVFPATALPASFST